MHLDAGHRHRLQPEEDQDAAEELGRPVGPAIQGPRRPDRAQQPARHRVPRRDQPAARRQRGEFRAGLQGAAASCCRTSARSAPISAPTRRCGSRSRSTSRPTISISCRRSRARTCRSSCRSRRPGRSAGPPACTWSRTRPSPISRCSTSTPISIRRCRARCSSRPTTSSRPTARCSSKARSPPRSPRATPTSRRSARSTGTSSIPQRGALIERFNREIKL